jgi:imidazolonepropionase-like amidohydrolase
MNCVHAKTIYTGSSVQRDAYLLFDGEKLAGFSASRKGELVGECAVLTPAFIDAHSHIGIHRHGYPSAEGEANDQLDSVLPLPDVLDSIQMEDLAFREAIDWGSLYSCVMPGSLNLISGRSAVIRHYAATSTEALICRAGIKGALGYNPMTGRESKGTRASTRMGAFAVLRGKFYAVQAKQRKIRREKKKGKLDTELTAEESVLEEILSGKTRLRVHAHKIDDIAALLRLVDELGLNISVEHAMDVNAPEIFVELKKRKIPVIYGPVETAASKVELKNKSWRNARFLVESGVRFGVMTDHPVITSSQILQQTRYLLRAGLTKQAALELVTRGNAEILGIDRFLGTLDKGKWASFLCWDGDPFDIACHPTSVYGEGRLLASDSGCLPGAPCSLYG